jgi:hypothetical protein
MLGSYEGALRDSHRSGRVGVIRWNPGLYIRTAQYRTNALWRQPCRYCSNSQDEVN